MEHKEFGMVEAAGLEPAIVNIFRLTKTLKIFFLYFYIIRFSNLRIEKKINCYFKLFHINQIFKKIFINLFNSTLANEIWYYIITM